jgi:hypothetical protein
MIEEDRCYLSVTYSKADEAAFKACEELSIDPDSRWAKHNYDEDEGAFTATWGEELDPFWAHRALINLGRPCLGWHGSGMAFGPWLFVFDGQTFFCCISRNDIESDDESYLPTVGVNPDGTIPELDLDNAMKYFGAVEWVEFYFKIQAERHNKNGG